MHVLKKILQQKLAEYLAGRANDIVSYFKSPHIPSALVRDKTFVFENVSQGKDLAAANKHV
jgi:hypothetical protein